jgi:hypothetical protein
VSLPQICTHRTDSSAGETDSPWRTWASAPRKLTLNQTPVIAVTGKAFFDVGHSLKDQKSNRRIDLPGYAAWEIHPVMALRVVQAHTRVLASRSCRRKKNAKAKRAWLKFSRSLWS